MNWKYGYLLGFFFNHVLGLKHCANQKQTVSELVK